MAFPSVQARTVWRGAASNATSHSVTMPGSISAGDLLICVFSADQAPTCSTTSSGWIKLGQASNSTVVTGAIFWKIAAGSDTLTVTTSTSEQCSAITYRITGGYYVTGTSANGSSTNSNPPSHAASDGTQDYLWIATRSGDSTVVATVAPSSYSNLTTQAAAGTAGASTNVADRTLNTGSAQDPDTFTSASEQWVSWTLCVSPVQTAVTVSPASDTLAVGEWADDLTANVQRNSVNIASLAVTATSSSTSTVEAYPVSAKTSFDISTYSSLGELTYSTPGGTSPSGATIRRFTETTATANHAINVNTTGLSGRATGDTCAVSVEIKPTRGLVRVDYSGANFVAADVDCVTPANSVSIFGTSTRTTVRDLGSGWYEVTCWADSAGTTANGLYILGLSALGTSSYTGDTGQYIDIGRVTLWRSGSTGGTTDASGNCSILLIPKAAGTANVTATSLFVTSSASAITVSSAQTLTATRFTDGDTFGSPTLSQASGGAQTLTATRFTDGDTFGTHALRARTTLVAQRVIDADSWGNHALRAIARLGQQTHSNTSTFGNATLVQGAAAQTLVASRIVDGDTFGNASLRARITLPATLYANTSTFGNAALRARYTLGVQRIVDGDAFGNAVLRARTTLAAQRVVDGDTFGNATIRARATLVQQTLTNASTFGNATLLIGDGKQYLSASSIVGAATFGDHALLRGSVTLFPQRIGATTGGGLGPAPFPSLGLLLSDEAASGNTFGNHTLIQPGVPQTLVAEPVVNESSFGAHTLVGGDSGAVTPPVEKERGPGGVRPRRRYLRVWDGEEWVEVHSVEDAQALIERVEAKAAQDAQEAAQRLAERPKVRMRAARRAAPVVRVDAPQEDLAAIQRRVEATNARLREMYENALRAEMIGRLIRQRLEEDEEDAILALLD